MLSLWALGVSWREKGSSEPVVEACVFRLDWSRHDLIPSWSAGTGNKAATQHDS